MRGGEGEEGVRAREGASDGLMSQGEFTTIHDTQTHYTDTLMSELMPMKKLSLFDTIIDIYIDKHSSIYSLV